MKEYIHTNEESTSWIEGTLQKRLLNEKHVEWVQLIAKNSGNLLFEITKKNKQYISTKISGVSGQKVHMTIPSSNNYMTPESSMMASPSSSIWGSVHHEDESMLETRRLLSSIFQFVYSFRHAQRQQDDPEVQAFEARKRKLLAGDSFPSEKKEQLALIFERGFDYAGHHLTLVSIDEHMAHATAKYKALQLVLCNLPIGVLIAGLSRKCNIRQTMPVIDEVCHAICS
mmetsp:Transcript_2472/g.3593  ORF Transcript_2472/g.3593 Transcript_2472/m.3593 type:complete len:228 (+) Transcript_2472:30-713(+)